MTGATFFRTSAGSLRAPWQVATFGLALVAAGAVVTAVGFAIIAPTPVERWARIARIPLDQVVTLASLVIATWFTGMALGRGGATWEYSGVGRGAWRARPLLGATAAGIGVVALPALALLAAGAVQLEPAQATDSTLTTAWAALALMVPAAWSEELLFRGFVFSVVRDAVGVSRAIAYTSVGFGLAHLFNPDPGVVSTLAVTVAGVFLAVVRVASGSLVAAFVAHFCINYTQAVVLHAPVSGLALQTPGYRLVDTGPDWITGGAWGLEGGAAVVVAMLVASFLLKGQKGEGRRETAEDRNRTEGQP